MRRITMSKLENYFKDLGKQKYNVKEIRENNLELWKENYKYNTKNIDNIDKEKIEEFLTNKEERFLDVYSEDALNYVGALMIYNGIIDYDSIIYLDYPYVVLNFYDFGNSEIRTIKNRIYDTDTKLFFIKGWPTPGRSAFDDANATKFREMIESQIKDRQDTRFVVDFNSKGGKEIFESLFRKRSQNSKNDKYRLKR